MNKIVVFKKQIMSKTKVLCFISTNTECHNHKCRCDLKISICPFVLSSVFVQSPDSDSIYRNFITLWSYISIDIYIPGVLKVPTKYYCYTGSSQTPHEAAQAFTELLSKKVPINSPPPPPLGGERQM